MVDKRYIIGLLVLGMLFNGVFALIDSDNSSWQYMINYTNGFEKSFSKYENGNSFDCTSSGTGCYVYYFNYDLSYNRTAYYYINDSAIENSIFGLGEVTLKHRWVSAYNSAFRVGGVDNITTPVFTTPSYDSVAIANSGTGYRYSNITEPFKYIWDNGAGWLKFIPVTHAKEDRLGGVNYNGYQPTIYFNATLIAFTDINVVRPQNISYSDASQVWLNFTPINKELSEIQCYYYLNSVEYNLGNVTNNTLSSTTGFSLNSFNNIYVKCINGDSSYNETTPIYFSIDYPPIVNILNVETDYSFNNSNIEVLSNATDIEDSSLSCKYTLDGSDYTPFNILVDLPFYKIYGGITNGEHSLVLNCSDSFGSYDIEVYNFTISEGTLKVCFYTYDDYHNYILNNSLTVGYTPNALRNIVLFNDSLARVWAIQNFYTLPVNYYCGDLENGCVELVLHSTGNYNIYIADNVDFNNNCVPSILNPRYYEEVGRFSFYASENKTVDRFISFEDSKNMVTSGDSILQGVRESIFMILCFVVLGIACIAGMSGGGSLALIVAGGGLLLLYIFRSSILSGGLI